MVTKKRETWMRRLPGLFIAAALAVTVAVLGSLALEGPEASASGKCYNCDPPEISSIDQPTQEATLRTPDQSAGGYSLATVALSYFAGLVKGYLLGDPGSGTATVFTQSEPEPPGPKRQDWLFAVPLDEPYMPDEDVGISLRKVDEPATPQKGDGKACPQQVPDAVGSFVEISPALKAQILDRFDLCRGQYGMSWRECHYGTQAPQEPMIRLARIDVPEQGDGREEGDRFDIYDVCVEVTDLEIPFLLDPGASYGDGKLRMDFLLGTPAPATWVTVLVLTSPTVQVVPLWTVPLPLLDPPRGFPVAFPFQESGWVGVYTGLFTTDGPKALKIAWVDTGGVSRGNL